MMNAARYAVGMQGIAVAERAYQKAAAFAKERVQSRPVDGSLPGSGAIIHHPDVKRMLMTMRAYVEGCRAMAITAAAAFDASHHHPDADVRKQNQAFYEFMVPLIKGFSTEMSVEVASFGVQVHGGMGFIEETGAAQHYRDARISPIYEGTNGIQAIDLVGRKVGMADGAVMRGLCAELALTAEALTEAPELAGVGRRLAAGVAALERATDWVLANGGPDRLAAATPYLKLAGDVIGGAMLGRQALLAAKGVAAGSDDPWLQGKGALARVYASQVLSQAPGLADGLTEGAADLEATAATALAS
jgi:hypothetical protein